MNTIDVTISGAGATAPEELLALLAAAGLPHEGVREGLSGFLVARDVSGRLVGCIGLERYGELALLRSAAVLPEFQGARIGSRLTAALLDRAAGAGVKEVVLLTTSARGFFAETFGFQVADRADYEARLMVSPEWRLPRCSSAVLMSLKLRGREGRPRPPQ